LSLDVLFISSRGSQYRYYQSLAENTGFTALVATHFPGYGFKLFNTGLTRSIIDEGIEFHLERKYRKYASHLPSTLFFSAYRFFSILYFSIIYLKFRYYFGKKKPKIICIWNGHRLPEMAIKAAAKGFGIKIAYFENGLLPKTTTMDFSGVNSHSSLPNDPNFYLDYYRSLSGTDLVDIDKTLVARKPHKKRESLVFKEFDLSKDYFFVPFQVNFDSQVIINSPRVNSMEAFYRLLERAIDVMGEGSPVFLVKEHPSDVRTYPELHCKNPKIIFVNNNTEELIENAQAVITLNSSVGIEAVLLSKRVIVLGSACYSVAGLTDVCTSKEEFISYLSEVDVVEPLAELRLAFFTYLIKEYLLPGAWQGMQNKIEQSHLCEFDKKINLEI
jgi:capsular polysaccharide export protein